MKLLDKLKNALFEEEYIEVDEIDLKDAKRVEKPKKKKEKEKKEEVRSRDVRITNYQDDKKKIEEKPIAKKIVTPKGDTPSRSVPKRVSEDVVPTVSKPSSNPQPFTFPAIDDSDFSRDNFGVKVTEIEEVSVPKPVKKEVKPAYMPKEKKNETILYKTSKEEEYVKKYTSHEYGNYERGKKSKKVFKPSPNISPVYGIIGDQDIEIEIPKREVKITTPVKSEKPDIDDVRRKAYGNHSSELPDDVMSSDLEEEVSIDLREEEAPKVNKVTMGDAEEYFQDLGLEYNKDYIDAKKEKTVGRRSDKKSKKEEETPNFLKEKEKHDDTVQVSSASLDNSFDDDVEQDDDNLFDLIDSMYDK